MIVPKIVFLASWQVNNPVETERQLRVQVAPDSTNLEEIVVMIREWMEML